MSETLACYGASRGLSVQRARDRNALRQALHPVCAAALRFYRLNPSTGPTTVDASTCAKRGKLDKEFAILWRGSQNSE